MEHSKGPVSGIAQVGDSLRTSDGVEVPVQVGSEEE